MAMVRAMPEPGEPAQAKKWVPPWRGPTPFRKPTAEAALTVALAVGGWAVIADSISGWDSDARSPALRMFGSALFWVVLSVWGAVGRRQWWYLVTLVVYGFILLGMGYELATS
jgi:hypothetical protein